MQEKYNKGKGAGGIPFTVRIKSHLWSIVLAANVLVLLSFMITGLVGAQSTVFGVKPMWIATDSMVPTLCVGQWVIGVPVSAEEVQVGEILAYRQERTASGIKPMIIHRLVEITEDGQYIFKGDNNTHIDKPVEAGNILYRIVFPQGQKIQDRQE